MTPLMIALKNHKRVEAIVNSLITTKGADLNLTDKVVFWTSNHLDSNYPHYV